MNVSGLVPTLPSGFASPFNYSSLSQVKCYFECSGDWVDQFNIPEGLRPYKIRGSRVVYAAYQGYLADFGTASTIVHEIEFGLVAARSSFLAEASWEDFLGGFDQGSNIGLYPLQILTDSAAARDAGVAVFGEPKAYGNFTLGAAPCPNLVQTQQWQVSSSSETTGSVICIEVMAQPERLVKRSNSVSVTFGVRNDEVVASRLVTYGQSLSGEISADQASIIVQAPGNLDCIADADLRAVAVEQYLSDPVSYRGRPFYV